MNLAKGGYAEIWILQGIQEFAQQFADGFCQRLMDFKEHAGELARSGRVGSHFIDIILPCWQTLGSPDRARLTKIEGQVGYAGDPFPFIHDEVFPALLSPGTQNGFAGQAGRPVSLRTVFQDPHVLQQLQPVKASLAGDTQRLDDLHGAQGFLLQEPQEPGPDCRT